MKKSRAFDCVEMKDAAQARLREEYQGLTPDQVRKKREESLATSDSPVARKCRRLAEQRQRAEGNAVSAGHGA